jgi:tetratricopeptide (TPR) repeat protein
MTRTEAFALVSERGGTARRGVTKRTAVLIVGEFGWPLLANGRPSNSLSRARAYGVPVVSERRFREWVGKEEPESQAGTYTPDQLAALSGLPAEIVVQLGVFGLIEPRGGLYGFRDLAAARQLAGLLDAGVPLSAITRSLHEIRKWLPDAGLSKLRLFPQSSDSILVEQLEGRTDKSGQFLLPVEAPSDNPDMLFEQAQSAEEADDKVTAERLYRRVIKLDPADPAAPFNLGNLLRSAGRGVEAELAFRTATKADPDYADAWYNLGDILDEQGRTGEAIACLKRAVASDPAYADAMFNLALLYQRRNEPAEAATWWRQYLRLDQGSPWAARARRALKYCEMQIARP